MNVKEQLGAADVDVDRRVYGDRLEIVADFGQGAGPSVDVVDGTVILVADEQYELDVEGDVQAAERNGVVTIEVNE